MKKYSVGERTWPAFTSSFLLLLFVFHSLSPATLLNCSFLPPHPASLCMSECVCTCVAWELSAHVCMCVCARARMSVRAESSHRQRSTSRSRPVWTRLSSFLQLETPTHTSQVGLRLEEAVTWGAGRALIGSAPTMSRPHDYSHVVCVAWEEEERGRVLYSGDELSGGPAVLTRTLQ